MGPPTNASELRRFIGMVNHLRKFSRNLAQLIQPLRELLSKKHTWLWGPTQDQAFADVKAELAKPTILTLYDQEAEKKISADSSCKGVSLLGSLSHNYASCSMTGTERHYAQIEKERRPPHGPVTNLPATSSVRRLKLRWTINRWYDF